MHATPDRSRRGPLLPPGAGIVPGVHATSDVVAPIFGAHTPAAVTVPDESTGR